MSVRSPEYRLAMSCGMIRDKESWQEWCYVNASRVTSAAVNKIALPRAAR